MRKDGVLDIDPWNVSKLVFTNMITGKNVPARVAAESEPLNMKGTSVRSAQEQKIEGLNWSFNILLGGC